MSAKNMKRNETTENETEITKNSVRFSSWNKRTLKEPHKNYRRV